MVTASSEPVVTTVEGLPRSCLDTLADWQPDEAGQESLRQRFLDHLRRRPDGWSRTCPDAHLTASALICAPDTAQVLLVAHRKARRWLQVGGHLEPTDATLMAAALREATEESGLTGLRIDPRPLRLSAHPVPFCNGGSEHLDVQFLITPVEPPSYTPLGRPEPTVSLESDDVRWFESTEVPTEECSVVELIAAAGRRLGWPSTRG